MSKSLGNVTDPMQAMDDFGVDAVRFYLARAGGRWKDDVGKVTILLLLRE
jgi:methionyl-tRNA synthetase